MHEAHAVLASWADFYVVAGTASASLTGLMFVVVTLLAGTRTEGASEAMGTFNTPTVLHFCNVLLLSGVLVAPWHTLWHAAAVVGVVGAYGVIHLIVVAVRTTRITAYRPGLDDWLWYTIAPLLAYLLITGAAVRLTAAPSGVMFALAAGVLGLIFIGIRNAWDVVTWVAVHRYTRGDASSPPQSRDGDDAAE